MYTVTYAKRYHSAGRNASDLEIYTHVHARAAAAALTVVAAPPASCYKMKSNCNFIHALAVQR